MSNFPEIKKEDGRLYIEDENNNMLAEITYSSGNKAVIADSTFVDMKLRGHGIAEKLLDALVEEIENQNKKIHPLCSYVVKMFDLKPEKYAHIDARK